MKRFYCLLAIAFLMLVSAQAQQVTFDEFIQKYQPLKEKEYQFIAEKKYAECIEVLKQQIDLCENAQIVDNQRIVSEEELKSSMGFAYYNMACCYALTGKKKQAIEALRQAIDHNWNNYINLKNDMESGDFVSIAKNKEAIHNGTEKQTVDYYLRTYMAKNLYMIACPMKLMFNAEPRYGKPTIDYMQLVPTGFEPYTHPAYTVHDADIFWAAPK